MIIGHVILLLGCCRTWMSSCSTTSGTDPVGCGWRPEYAPRRRIAPGVGSSPPACTATTAATSPMPPSAADRWPSRCRSDGSSATTPAAGRGRSRAGSWADDPAGPPTGRITASFAAVAKHYGVSVAICPARRGNRKGVVEKANHTAAQRWWRTLADEVSVEQAQASLDRWCLLRGDTRMRPTSDGKSTVATVAATDLTPCRPFPAVLAVAGSPARKRWSPSAATTTRCQPSWPAPRSQ